MPSIGTSLKREGVTQGWQFIIKNATGEDPYIRRTDRGNYITWKPGQADKMRKYLNRAVSEESDYNPEGINVDVDLLPVLLPLAVQKTIGYIAIYTAAVFLLGKFWKDIKI
jgi:hypothetical protein